MYWYSKNTGELICKIISESTSKQIINYTRDVKRKIMGRLDLITMHSHLRSFPSSISDFNSVVEHNYAESIVICHDGKVYVYSADYVVSEVEMRIFMHKVSNHYADGYTEKDAQIKALKELNPSLGIKLEEVTACGKIKIL